MPFSLKRKAAFMESLLFDIDSEADTSAKTDGPDFTNRPLAAKLRPFSFDEFVGQKHLLGKDCLLRKAIDSDSFSSIVLFGPPGVGKTSLAELIARLTDAVFIRLSGVVSKVSDLRKEIASAIARRDAFNKKTIIFVDEIHRFNRAQQDSLLPDIENGNIRFIGATTQNPHFFVISPLLSRSLVFRLEPLSEDDIKTLLTRAVKETRGFGEKVIKLSSEALVFWSEVCEGDARRALNALEIAVLTAEPDTNGEINISLADAEASIQQKSINYGDDEHYDTISAFIKSMRGSDPDAALYWLARMLKSGEDIMFIARRIVIFASEDIGNADPRAVEVAVSIMKAVEMIGMPEARILLAQAVTYCATAPKSNAAYAGIKDAMKDIENNRIQPVPIYLKSSYCSSSGEKNKEKYKYPHNYKDNIVKQSYMGVSKKYYKPSEMGYERKIKERLNYWKSLEAVGSSSVNSE
jgi:putative ATPase